MQFTPLSMFLKCREENQYLPKRFVLPFSISTARLFWANIVLHLESFPFCCLLESLILFIEIRKKLYLSALPSKIQFGIIYALYELIGHYWAWYIRGSILMVNSPKIASSISCIVNLLLHGFSSNVFWWPINANSVDNMHYLL